MFKILVGSFFMFLQVAQAQTSILLKAKATNNKSLVYTEEHRIEYSSDGRVTKSKTEYFDPEGKKIAELSSDYSQNMAAPAHDFHDLRFDLYYGLRNEGADFVMYSREGKEKEETKKISGAQSDKLIVGGQGLGYYFQYHIETLKQKNKVPLLFLIPGRLDAYNFELEYKGRTDGEREHFEIHIKNWLLSLFAPKLVLHLDPVKKQLLQYEGISNILNKSKKEQNVVITYQWPD